MKWHRCVLLFAISVASSGCVTRVPQESLTFSVPKNEQWVVGNHSVVRGVSILNEMVRKGESIKKWTELFSIFNLPLTPSSPPREQLMSELKAKMQKRCPNVVWNAIQTGPSDILYEWRIAKCSPHPDQHEIARIMDGEVNRFRIAYTAKTTEMPADRRKEWMDILLAARYQK